MNRNLQCLSPEKGTGLNPEKGYGFSPVPLPSRNSVKDFSLVGDHDIRRSGSATQVAEVDKQAKRIMELKEENAALLDVLDSLNVYLDRIRTEKVDGRVSVKGQGSGLGQWGSHNDAAELIGEEVNNTVTDFGHPSFAAFTCWCANLVHHIFVCQV